MQLVQLGQLELCNLCNLFNLFNLFNLCNLCNLCKHLAEQPRTPQSSLPAASRQSCNVAVWGRQARQAACALLLVDKSEEVQCRRSCQAAAWSLTAPHLARIQSAGGQNLPRRARNLHSDLYLFHFLIKPLAYSILKKTRSSWLSYALRDDEAVYWVIIGHYEAVAVGN